MDNPAQESAPVVTRRTVFAAAGVGGLGVILAARGLGPAVAQEASPAVTTGGPVGVVVEPLGGGLPGLAPGLELTLRRITIAPDGGIPAHSHPGALVIVVESGTFGYIALGGTAQMTRAAVGDDAPSAEAMSIGTEVILHPGDSIFVEEPQDAIRNAGNDEVVLLVAGLTRQGEPFTTLMPGMDMEATPGTTPTS